MTAVTGPSTAPIPARTGRQLLAAAGRGAVAALVVGVAGLAVAWAVGLALVEGETARGDLLAIWPVVQLGAVGISGSTRSLVGTEVLAVETQAVPYGWTLLAVLVVAAVMPRSRGLPRLTSMGVLIAVWAVLHTALTVAGAAVLRDRIGTLVELDAIAMLTAAVATALVAAAGRAVVDSTPTPRLVVRLRAQLLAGLHVALGFGAFAGAATVALVVIRAHDGADAMLTLALSPLYAVNWMVIGLTGALGGAVHLPATDGASTPVALPRETLVQLVAETVDVPVGAVTALTVAVLTVVLGRAVLGIARRADWRSGTEVAVDVLGTTAWFGVAVAVAGTAATITARLVAVPSSLPNPVRTVAIDAATGAAIPAVFTVGLVTVVLMTAVAMRFLALSWAPAHAVTVASPGGASAPPVGRGSETKPALGYCTACGSARRPDTAFCTGCGRRFSHPEPPAPST